MNQNEELGPVLTARPVDPAYRPEGPRPAARPALDVWALLECLRQRWLWLVAGAALLALSGGVAAWVFCPVSYTCTAQMIRYDPPVASDAFRPRSLTTATLLGLIQSTEVLKRLGAGMTPRQTPAQLSHQIQVTLDRQSDITMVAASGRDPRATADLVNGYCAAAIGYTQDLQRQEAAEANRYADRQLDHLKGDIAAVRAAAQQAVIDHTPPPPPAAPDELTRRIEAARDDLANLLMQYTDNHPLVRAQRSKLELLEREETERNARRGTAAPALPTEAAITALPASAGRGQDLDMLRAQLSTLETSRAQVIERSRAVQQFMNNPAGYFQVSEPAVAREALVHRPGLKIAFFAILGGLVGLFAAAGQAVLLEFADNRLKTTADVRRVTGLPVLATLGDLADLAPPDQDLWGFRTWTVLQNYLSPSPNHGIVCGFVSADSGDGTTSWVRLMGRAASQCGFRVLTISARSALFGSNGQGKHHKGHASSRSAPPPPPAAPPKESTALTTNVLATPGQITEKLLGPNPEPSVHIPLPGWVWNLDRRKQWQTALESWSQIDNIVILVDLPPASVPEAVLLGQNVPNLIWLTESGRSDATRTVEQLLTLRHARCNFVGAVLNGEQSPPVKRRFTRWVGNGALLLCLGLGLAASGRAASAAPAATRPSISIPAAPETPADSERTGPEDSNAQVRAVRPNPAAASPGSEGIAAGPAGVPAPVEPVTFSAQARARRADWQRELTLGPGDVLTFHLFSRPDLTAEEVPVGPDGTISYLEAGNVRAAGLTVDQLRDRMNDELGHYRRSPQVFVYPVAYRSKKYYMLGTVVHKGVFVLDRPTTIIEAVARAQGLETGISDRTMVELADFSRSFISRGGRHLPVDFEKLFLSGDLSQNVALEPGDYLYFPANDTREVYVLGAVLNPGAVNYNSSLGSITAIAMRGGFSTRAWTQHLLVVRGSLNHPETFVIDAKQVLAGEAPDFRLKPRDIVYVSTRPWIRVEEILDLAASAFVESAVVTWTGIHAGPRFQ